MGRATEYIAYLKTSPSQLIELKKELFYITLTDDMKAKHRELKLYKE